jgi:bifunctional non-homologous end joining protein LigD
VHEVKRAGRVRLYTMNAADWTERYPLIVEAASRLKRHAVFDCEVICPDEYGRADFDRLHSRCFEHEAVACAFDLLRLDGDDLRRLPLLACLANSLEKAVRACPCIALGAIRTSRRSFRRSCKDKLFLQ